MINTEKLIQVIILQALNESPKGLTTKQILKIVSKKLKNIKKMLDIYYSL